jgi:hypothetical protein
LKLKEKFEALDHISSSSAETRRGEFRVKRHRPTLARNLANSAFAFGTLNP